MLTDAAAKNIDLVFEVIRQVIANPRLADELDELCASGTLVVYDPSDSELTLANDQLVAIMRDRGDLPVAVELQRELSLTLR